MRPQEINRDDPTIALTAGTRLIADFSFPTHSLNLKEYILWRNTCYRRCEECHIRAFMALHSPDTTVPKDATLFWCYVYSSVRVLTSKMFTFDMIYSRRYTPSTEDDVESDLLSWWGLACRSQFWLDRQGIKVHPHIGQFDRHGIRHTLPRRFYHA